MLKIVLYWYKFKNANDLEIIVAGADAELEDFRPRLSHNHEILGML